MKKSKRKKYIKNNKPNPRWSIKRMKKWSATKKGHRWAGFLD